MRALLVGCLSAAIASAGAAHAAADPVTVAAFIAEAAVEMRKWQDKQGWGKFRSARYGRPVRLLNATNKAVTFTYEGENCERARFKLQAYRTTTIRCSSTSGNDWWEISVSGGVGGTLDEGASAIFDYEDGKVTLIDVTPDVRDQAKKPRPPPVIFPD
ncbi:UNVERIFIED_ORG: hypothetical protein GGE64_000697 [Rhizobium etli]